MAWLAEKLSCNLAGSLQTCIVCAQLTYQEAIQAFHELLVLFRLTSIILTPFAHGLHELLQQWGAQLLCCVSVMVEVVPPLAMILREIWVLSGVHDPAVGCQVHNIVFLMHEVSLRGLVRKRGIAIMHIAEVWAICHCVLSLAHSDCNGVADRKVWHVRIALYHSATVDLQEIADNSELVS